MDLGFQFFGLWVWWFRAKEALQDGVDATIAAAFKSKVPFKGVSKAYWKGSYKGAMFKGP